MAKFSYMLERLMGDGRWLVWLAVLLCAAGVFCGGYSLGVAHRGVDSVRVVSVRVDTFTITEVKEVERKVVDVRLVPLTRTDTVFSTDTLRLVGDSAVAVPVEQRHYADTAYEAWVSGYRPRLDSIRVYERVSSVVVRDAPVSRWGVGLSAGLGLTPRGVLPYVGVGVTYRLYVR